MQSPLFALQKDNDSHSKGIMYPLSFDSTVYENNDDDDDDDDDLKPLLLVRGDNSDRIKPREALKHHLLHSESSDLVDGSTDRIKTALLSFSLFATLMSFWMLDSIKDPILAVCSTLYIV
jgi:hypothetical protein